LTPLQTRYEEGGETIKEALEVWTSLGPAMDPVLFESFQEGILGLKNALDQYKQQGRVL
jgi:hypothetical protein